MEKRGLDREKLLRRMEKLAQCRVNDAVRLAFLDGQWGEEIQKMDLTALAELKRNGNGTVEMKFIDRVAILNRLVELTKDSGQGKAEAFFQALGQQSESGDLRGI